MKDLLLLFGMKSVRLAISSMIDREQMALNLGTQTNTLALELLD